MTHAFTSAKWKVLAVIAVLAVAAALCAVPMLSWADTLTTGTGSATTSGAANGQGSTVYATTKAKTATVKGRSINNGTYVIASAAGTQLNQMAGIKKNSKKKKAIAEVQKESGKKAQRWTFTYNKYTDSYTIVNKNSKLALSVKGKAKKNAKLYQVKSKHGVSSQPKAQRWKVVATSKGYKIVSGLNAKYVLTVKGSTLTLAKSNNSASQRFWLFEASTWNTKKAAKAANLLKDGYYTLRPKTSPKLLALSELTAKQKTPFALQDNNGELEQMFKITHLAGKYYKIEDVATGQVLTEKNTSEGALVVQANYGKKNSAQKWAPAVSPNGGLVFINKESKRVLDLEGTKVVVKTRNDNAASQTWAVSPTTVGVSQMQLKALDRANANNSNTNYYISIDYTNHRCYIFSREDKKDAWELLKDWKCSTPSPVYGKGLLKINKSRNAKTTGQFKYQTDKADEKGYTAYYYTGLGWGTWIHSILFRPYTHRVSDGRLGVSCSAGCTRLAVDNARWVYNNIPAGTGRSTYV